MGRQYRDFEVYLVYVDPKKCDGCQQCVNFCYVDVFDKRSPYAFPAKPQNCLGCRTCEGVCQQKAITITEI